MNTQTYPTEQDFIDGEIAGWLPFPAEDYDVAAIVRDIAAADDAGYHLAEGASVGDSVEKHWRPWHTVARECPADRVPAGIALGICQLCSRSFNELTGDPDARDATITGDGDPAGSAVMTFEIFTDAGDTRITGWTYATYRDDIAAEAGAAAGSERIVFPEDTNVRDAVESIAETVCRWSIRD